MSEPNLSKVNGNPIVEEVDSDNSRRHSMDYEDPPEEEIIDERGTDEKSKQNHSKTAKSGDGKEPAYVAPIPKIEKIPPITRPSSTGRPHFPRLVTASLVGKKIDEYGDVVDDDGKVLGRVAGDLPSMVGRAVLNQRGDVLGDDGELLGYVAEVESEKQKRAQENGHSESDDSTTQSMDEYMSKNESAFRIDQKGNILDRDGNVVGSFHDFNRMGPKEPKSEPISESKSERSESGKSAEAQESTEAQEATPETEAGKDGKRPNAQSHRKENDSPSDIFLDVKSTREGIQLTIRIPTVFPVGGQPRVQFS